jgi:hypothetical protein
MLRGDPEAVALRDDSTVHKYDWKPGARGRSFGPRAEIDETDRPVPPGWEALFGLGGDRSSVSLL